MESFLTPVSLPVCERMSQLYPELRLSCPLIDGLLDKKIFGTFNVMVVTGEQTEIFMTMNKNEFNDHYIAL